MSHLINYTNDYVMSKCPINGSHYLDMVVITHQLLNKTTSCWSKRNEENPLFMFILLWLLIVYRWRFIEVEYGEETWFAMLEKVGLSRSMVFRTHHIYSDDLIPKLADAAVQLLAPADAALNVRSDFLRFFGRCFVRYFSHYGYEKFIKVSTSIPWFLIILYCSYLLCTVS